MKKVWSKIWSSLLLSFSAIILIFPLWVLVIGSFMGKTELLHMAGAVLGKEGRAHFYLFPSYPTFSPFIKVFLDSPEFFHMFWNSCGEVFPILVGQFLVGIPAAYGFAHYNFMGKRVLWMIYLTLMILPFQVTMVSNYLVLSQINLLDTPWSVILPAIFATFPVFLMKKFFSSIPKALFEAAAVDGAGEIRIFFTIGIPLCMPGIFSTGILEFIEYWNAMEAPLTFIKDQSLWPLSLYLSSITSEQIGSSFAASVIMMLPSCLLFWYGQDYLEQGIATSGIKE